MNESFLRGIRRTGQLVRDGWLMLGSVLLILLVIEVGYRVQSNARSALRTARGPGSVRSPYADSSWNTAFQREYEATFHEHWKPFVYFRRGPFVGAMINVDSAGHRRTVSAPPRTGASDTVKVFFFGGSTMWGTNLRDNSTIPSVAAQRLPGALHGNEAIEVTNFGESGYVFTQELLELELQLRAGNVPDVVLFYDGINDMAAAVQYGAAGTSQNESNRSSEFDFGRAVSGTESGVGSDLRAAAAIGGAVLRRVQFVRRLVGTVARPPAAAPSSDWLARDVAKVYGANVELVEALSRAYGFQVMYVWQPALFSTSKVLTPFEKLMQAKANANPLFAKAGTMVGTTTSILDSTLSMRVGARFVDETRRFAGDTSAIFSDEVGHTTEHAVPTIVDGFLPGLASLADSAAVMRSRGRVTSGAAPEKRVARPKK